MILSVKDLHCDKVRFSSKLDIEGQYPKESTDPAGCWEVLNIICETMKSSINPRAYTCMDALKCDLTSVLFLLGF